MTLGSLEKLLSNSNLGERLAITNVGWAGEATTRSQIRRALNEIAPLLTSPRNGSSADVLDAGGALVVLLGQPTGVDGAGVAGLVSAMDPREVGVEGLRPGTRRLTADTPTPPTAH